MTVSVCDRVATYEVQSLLGEGGMGQVYLARDTRLQRDVALKILHEAVSGDLGRLKRFENEARAASSLNHPNIVTIYDTETSGPVAWIAMERVEGATLRQAFSSRGVPARKLLSIAVQVADGLAAAHAAGIVHRDLKPENVMLTRDGLVKILDFGLAKLVAAGPEERGAAAPEGTGTFPGTVLGTVGYMSPEQAQGATVDYRSDQFAFGSVLYEMATGRRAFSGRTAVDTLAAILNEEPEPILRRSPQVPAPLCWVVERCLSKDPDHRYASTHDLARELKVLQDRWNNDSGEAARSVAPRPARGRRIRRALLAGAVVAGGVATYVIGVRAGVRPVPDFQRLTFPRGIIGCARFAPDGRTIVYSAAWNGEPDRIFSTRTDGRDSLRLTLPDAELLAVSSLGELALGAKGVLSRVPLTGGAPREMSEGVTDADWSPDGAELAVVRRVDGKTRLEYPPGTVLVQSDVPIMSPRVSPRGDHVAFLSGGEAIVSVETVDREGRRVVLSRDWKRAMRLAWSADGREIWFAANERGWRTALHAVSLQGKLRTVLRLPSWIALQDINRDGRVLLALAQMRATLRGRFPGQAAERDLSWHEGSFAKALTPDGKTLLFDEGGEAYFHGIYVRPTDGSPAKKIGEGRSMAISPDGRWVATNTKERGSATVLLPTGPGEPRTLDGGGHRFEEARFFPDGKRILLQAMDVPQSFVIDVPDGHPRGVAAPGARCSVVSPDGLQLACVGSRGEGLILPVDGGPSRPIPGFHAGADQPIEWSADGRSLFVGDASPGRLQFLRGHLNVFQIDLATGKRDLWHEFGATDTSDIAVAYYFTMTPDGKSYAYSSYALPSDLYLVTGLD